MRNQEAGGSSQLQYNTVLVDEPIRRKLAKQFAKLSDTLDSDQYQYRFGDPLEPLDLRHAIIDDECSRILVMDNNQLVGICRYRIGYVPTKVYGYHCYTTSKYKDIAMNSIYVVPEYRNRGISSYFLKTVDQLVKTEASYGISLTCFAENKHALNIYLNKGFIPVGLAIPFAPAISTIENKIILQSIPAEIAARIIEDSFRCVANLPQEKQLFNQALEHWPTGQLSLGYQEDVKVTMFRDQPTDCYVVQYKSSNEEQFTTIQVAGDVTVDKLKSLAERMGSYAGDIGYNVFYIHNYDLLSSLSVDRDKLPKGTLVRLYKPR